MIDRLSIKTKSILINSGVCVAAFAAIMALYYRFPVWYVYLISEDTPAEYATTTAYLAGCCMMAWAMIRNRDARTMINVLLLLFMFFVGMEEISWGQRIIGIETTDFFMEHNHQREFNLHNLSFVKYTKMLFHNGVLVWLLLSWIPWRKLGILGRLLEWLKVPKIPPFTAPYFILALVFAYFGIIPKSEEFNELIFAYGFAFLSLDIYYDTGPAADRDRLHILPAWLLTGAVVASALFLSVRWPWPDVLSSRMNLFAVKEYPRRGLDVQAEKVFEYLVATPELRNPDTLYNYAAFLRKRGEEERAQILISTAIEEKKKRIAGGTETGTAYYRMANFYASLSRRAEERRSLERAIELYTAEIRGIEEGLSSGKLKKKIAETHLRYAYDEVADAYERTGSKESAAKYRALLEGLGGVPGK
ncbi:MAG: tetratricopeptide repeat protein [Spirochaetota bacterium]|jgi:tetratricopeptide (TPR) repeat protein